MNACRARIRSTWAPGGIVDRRCDFYTSTTAQTLPGDCNANGLITSADIIYLVNYVFKGDDPPVVPGHGDVNCDESVSSADVITLVNYVFKSGTPPCDVCALIPSTWSCP